MNISIEYNFNLDTTYQPPVSEQLAGLFAMDSIRLFKLTDGQHLALNTHSRQRIVVKDNILSLFALCRRFRTLAEHRDIVAKELSGAGLSGEQIMMVLGQLKAAGLMVRADHWLERFPLTPGDSATRTDWVLAITTCDRPAFLQRLLDSAVPYITSDIRPVSVLLLDDSRKQDSISANRHIWCTWLEQRGLPGEYWGRGERARLCQILGRCFTQDDDGTISWLISPDTFSSNSFTIGQGRNLALLLAAGRRLLLLDDDCCLEPQWHPCCENRLQVGPVPVEIFPYTDQNALSKDVQPLELNPFEAHLQLLGASVRWNFDLQGLSWHEPTWVRSLDGTTLTRLAADSVTRITGNATLGDPGTASMSWLYTGPPQSNERLASYLQYVSEDDFLARLFWKGRHTHVLTYDEPLMTTTLTGIDNRILVPCVLPAGRVEDLMLGDGLYALHPQAMLFAFNWAMLHSPETKRYWQRPVAKPEPSTPSPAWFLSHSIGRAVDGCTVIEPRARLDYMASRYQELAIASDERLRQIIEAHYLAHQTGHLKACFESRSDGQSLGQPWQQDISKLIEATASSLGRPLDLSRNWLSEFRELSLHYAAALRLWPDLRETAIQRRAELVRAADVPVGSTP